VLTDRRTTHGRTTWTLDASADYCWRRHTNKQTNKQTATNLVAYCSCKWRRWYSFID